MSTQLACAASRLIGRAASAAQRCEQSRAVHAPALVVLERDARQHRVQVRRLRSVGGQEVEEWPVVQMHEHPADVEDNVADQAASVSLRIARPLYAAPARGMCGERRFVPWCRGQARVADRARCPHAAPGYNGNGITVPVSPGVALTATTVALGKKLNSEALAQV